MSGKVVPFTPAEFHGLVDSDVWVLEQMLTLPSDPEVAVTQTPAGIRIELFDTVGGVLSGNAKNCPARLSGRPWLQGVSAR